MSVVGPAVADVLGVDGTYWDPLWRVRVELSALERDLLRCWPVRRLGFVAHAGASAVATTQSGSRLEHSLGVLALVAHVAPGDGLARAAALLHDVGHLPLSHTLEGVAGLDHHTLGAARIRSLAELLGRHGVDTEDMVDVVDGRRASVLRSPRGVLKLDHLDGLVRSARAHGRTRQPPPETLARLRLVDGGVSADAATADLLVEMVAAEARLHTAPVNVVASAVVRHLVHGALRDAAPARVQEVAEMTDDELWALLLADPGTGRDARLLRRDPTAWRIAAPGDISDAGPDGQAATTAGFPFTISRLYLDLPLVDGRPTDPGHPALAGLPRMPWAGSVVPAQPA